MKEQLIEKPTYFKTSKVIPVLESDDICRGMFSGENKTHCLAGWIRTISKNWETRNFINHLVLDEIQKDGRHNSIVGFNDDSKTDKRKIARLFNRVMRKLGFTKIVDR